MVSARNLIRPSRVAFAQVLVILALAALPRTAFGQYRQLNLVSDLPRSQSHAIFRDPNLINPWGISFGPGSPFWISDNGTGVSTLYRGSLGIPLSLVVTIPPPPGGTGPAAPTGTVFNGTSDFKVSKAGNSGPGLFLFATEDGTISGWNPNVDLTNAVVMVDNSSSPGVDGTQSHAIYKGLEFSTGTGGNFIYAANFRDGIVEIYDGSFSFVKWFTDPSVTPDASAPGFAPFGIKNIGGQLYVTFAMQDSAKHDDVQAPGLGFVDIFDLQGNFVRQLVPMGGPLNAPYGLALAPSNFGKFSNDLLVGNFGGGRIDAFDPSNGNFLGQLADTRGTPISIEGLWALAFGNGRFGQRTNFLFFTAGIQGESHGLFGRLAPIRAGGRCPSLRCEDTIGR